MAVGALPVVKCSKADVTRIFIPSPRLSTFLPPSFMLPPETALFLAIDLHCRMQNMDSGAQTPFSEDDQVLYYVNRDFPGWVQQRVRRRVYIELKLECTRNRVRDHHKARDSWLCLYCRGSFPSKLRLTDHRVVGCPSGPVDSRGAKWELPVYPNLKNAKQGKDLKEVLRQGDGSVWQSLRDNDIWLQLNPELRDPVSPPPGAKVQVREFMEPTLERLAACPPIPGRPPKQCSPHPTPADFVDLEEDGTDEAEGSTAKPKKRSRAQMEEGHEVHHSPRQFRDVPRKSKPAPSRRSTGAERDNAMPQRHYPQQSRKETNVPPQPLRVTPIQSRSPSPDRAAILAPDTPVPHAPQASATPCVPPAPPMDHDIAGKLRKERQAFYIKAASEARSGVKMDSPKPPLRPPIQPPGLFHLLSCGLLKVDVECGDLQAFQEEVDKWKKDPSFQDRLFAAYGRFCYPSHQVQPVAFLHVFVTCNFLVVVVTCCFVSVFVTCSSRLERTCALQLRRLSWPQ